MPYIHCVKFSSCLPLSISLSALIFQLLILPVYLFVYNFICLNFYHTLLCLYFYFISFSFCLFHILYVCLFICKPVYPSAVVVICNVCLSFYVSAVPVSHKSAWLSIGPCFCLSIVIPLYLPLLVRPSICVSAYIFVNQSACLYVRLSASKFIFWMVRPFVFLFITMKMFIFVLFIRYCFSVNLFISQCMFVWLYLSVWLSVFRVFSVYIFASPPVCLSVNASVMCIRSIIFSLCFNL